MDKIEQGLAIGSMVVALASAISASLGLHKYDGIIGKVGKVIAVIGLNIGHAQNECDCDGKRLKTKK